MALRLNAYCRTQSCTRSRTARSSTLGCSLRTRRSPRTTNTGRAPSTLQFCARLGPRGTTVIQQHIRSRVHPQELADFEIEARAVMQVCVRRSGGKPLTKSQSAEREHGDALGHLRRPAPAVLRARWDRRPRRRGVCRGCPCCYSALRVPAQAHAMTPHNASGVNQAIEARLPP